ncbi:hypothetical protein [Dyella koreensis]|uniref:Uncharacterized protein n=1 Tax=Dyella koreensis TaxID=311235 RepID=A0ABW8K9J4_9GAMM
MPSVMDSSPHRASPIDVLRHLASQGSFEHPLQSGTSASDARAVAMRRDLVTMVSAIDPEDPAALAQIRQPMLRRIVLAEWGEGALSDPVSLVMLRAVDRLVAIDPELRELLQRAAIVLKREA